MLYVYFITKEEYKRKKQSKNNENKNELTTKVK